ncbi:spore germination protein [Paenibacillus radicis (ex Xue et al. 2023)]|uniref:Spore germination protein n=1 Tax=Paenibacillus radicis (ex Xue et al. 2023) TaxID=2972489 RepID=A0ABT1Y8W8_9BACL|nr:spore germination protein [Paenibacillus radicis (ex Xue et al. 2023)]MCR8629634.1 spore germination protein [Paenibacillus radicis (ex Xue et al. 2023)]
MTRWDERILREMFERCDDVKFIEITESAEIEKRRSLLLIYCEGLCDTKALQNTLLPRLQASLETDIVSDENDSADWQNMLKSTFKADASDQDVMDELFKGNLLVFEISSGKLNYVEMANRPERKPEDSSSEMTINGPRDSFIENLNVNIALIRKRLRSNTLCVEKHILGSRSRTEIGLLYLSDVLVDATLREVKEKLYNIETESVLSQEELKVLLTRTKGEFFPLMNLTTRTDMVADSLIKGRFVIMMDGNPTVLIAPVNISYAMTVGEDMHTPLPLLYIEMIMRRVGLLITLLMPGFWVALTSYHQDQIPFPLLATIAVATEGTPLSGPMEILLMTLLFQFFLEAGSRLPSALGPSISVVGGLIIGDAVIKAGLTSPATLVVAAVTSTAQFTLVGGLFGISVGLLRIYIFLFASFFGLFGFFTAVFSILIYMSNLKSFGVPYLAPFSPVNWKDLWFVLTLHPRGRRQTKPELLTPQKDHTGRRGGQSQ